MIDFDTVTSRKNTASMKWDKYRDRDVLPFWVADMDFKVAEPIQRAVEERVSHGVFGYTVPPDGMSESVIAHLKNEYQWDIDAKWLVWLPGVVSGLAISCRAYCDQGDEIIVNPPIYHHFYDSHEVDRHTIVKVPLQKKDNRWTYDLAAMESAFSDKTKMFMMCSPHNPTGTVFTADELQAAAALCERHDVVMISDEIHCDLVIDKSAQHYPTAAACEESAERIVTIMSGSKTWNIAGLNCSFAIIKNDELRDKFRAAMQSIVPSVPPLAYEATMAAYKHGGEWRKELLDYLANNFEIIKRELQPVEGLIVEPIQATYLAWIDATGLGLDDTQGFFEEHGVGLSSGEQFGQPQYVRLNFACSQEVLMEGLRRMKQAISTL